MVRKEPQAHYRIPWEDRFNRPSQGELREPLPATSARLFDTAREELGEIFGDRMRVDWLGSCWKWTLGFGKGRSREPLAVMIPNPDDLQIAMRVKADFIREVWPRRMKRAVRDGLGLAADPFDTHWGVWTITSKPMLEEVLRLVRDNVAFSEEAGIAPTRTRRRSR